MSHVTSSSFTILQVLKTPLPFDGKKYTGNDARVLTKLSQAFPFKKCHRTTSFHRRVGH